MPATPDHASHASHALAHFFGAFRGFTDQVPTLNRDLIAYNLRHFSVTAIFQEIPMGLAWGRLAGLARQEVPFFGECSSCRTLFLPSSSSSHPCRPLFFSFLFLFPLVPRTDHPRSAKRALLQSCRSGTDKQPEYR